MSELDDRIGDAQRVLDYLRRSSGEVTSPVITQPPVVTPPVVQQPPVAPITPVVSGPVSMQGDLGFNGFRFDTSGIVGPLVVACFRIVIPEGNLGKTAMCSVFENGNGTPWRHVTLSRTPGDMTPMPPAGACNSGPNLYMAIGIIAQDAITVWPGEVWYLNVKAEIWTAQHGYISPAVGPSQVADFGVKLYPPS